MSTRSVVGSVVASLSILVIGWQAGIPATAPTSLSAPAGTSAGATGGATGTATPSSAASPAPVAGATLIPAPAPSAGKTTTIDGTCMGSEVNTQYGSVQVQVTIAAGTITTVTPLKLTDAGRRSVSISNQASPILRFEVLSAQTANVDTVGGATYTSDAYLTSLQSALDQSRL